MSSNINLYRLNLLSLLLLIAAFVPTYAQMETGSKAGGEVRLTYFWSRYCPHCKEAKPFIEQLQKKYAWLNLQSYDLVGNKDNQQLYLEMAGQLGEQAKSVPAFIFCGQMRVGYDQAETTGQELEAKLIDCHKQIQPNTARQEGRFNIPWLGSIHYRDFSLPTFTLIIAALDAFNPCAFFVLIFLLSLMVHHHSRSKMLAVGTTFVLCSGLMYFLFMAAWLNLFLITEELLFITAIAGLIAIVFGLLNIKDYFFFKQGVSLSLSETSKDKLFTRIRYLSQNGNWPAMIIATIILAIAANSYELLCTAGLPMVFTRVLTLSELPLSQYYFYLAFYNIIYITPLLLIVIAFSWTLGRKKLSEGEGRLLKLMSGSMMLGLGSILMLKPEWLSNMMASITVIGTAVLLTGVAALMQRLK